jgi:hypothetical protein
MFRFDDVSVNNLGHAVAYASFGMLPGRVRAADGAGPGNDRSLSSNVQTPHQAHAA